MTGTRCKKLGCLRFAPRDSLYCFSHDPDKKEERKMMAEKVSKNIKQLYDSGYVLGGKKGLRVKPRKKYERKIKVEIIGK